MANEKLSAPRYRWNTHPAMMDQEAREQGAAWRTVRKACGLGLFDIADATGIPATDLANLEDGNRAFSEAADFYAALAQLWLWGSERRVLR